MKKKDWEVKCADCGKNMSPVPTSEEKTPEPDSVYALTKKFQEDIVLNVGKAYGIPSVALRFFNVVGTRQSLSNPYTGVAAIFMSRVKNANAPMIFEDGNQLRDFVSIKDIVEANMLAMKSKSADYEVFNVGSGKQTSIKGLAEMLIELHGANLKPEITENFRVGDVRHCFADISKIKTRLGFEPKVGLKEELKRLSEWSGRVEAVDRVEEMKEDLKSRNLVRG